MIPLPTAARPGFVAELGQTCGADVDAYCDAVHRFAYAGVWGVKVQMIDPDLLASAAAPPYWSTTRYAETQAESFRLAGCVPHDGWLPVREACADAGLAFVATPFDLGAIGPLLDLAPDAVKVASGDITFGPLLDAVGRSFSQVILSTGGADQVEVRSAVGQIMTTRRPDEKLMLLACSLQYPTPDEHANLARLDALRKMGTGDVGYSDHTVQTNDRAAFGAGAAAGALGAALVEKHCASLLGGDVGWPKVPDLDMAMTPDLVAEYVDGLTFGASLRGNADLAPHVGERAAVDGARRSLHLVAPLTGALPAGHVIEAGDLVALRPGGGLSPMVARKLVGRTLAVPAPAGRIVGWRPAVADASRVELSIG